MPHSTALRSVRRFFTWLLLVGLGVLLVGGGALFVFRDRVVGLFVAEANRHLRTEVAVGQIHLSWWDKFPQVALRFDNVRIADGLDTTAAPLAQLQRLFLTFDAWKLLQGQYELDRVYLEQGEVRLRVDAQGRENYHIVAVDTTAPQASETNPVTFDLRRLDLRHVRVTYERQDLRQHYALLADHAWARLRLDSSGTTIELAGDLRSDALQIEQDVYFRDKPLQINAALHYAPATDLLTIRPSELTVAEARFDVTGTVGTDAQALLDLRVRGQSASLKTLLSLLPQATTRSLRAYRSAGEIYFDAHLQGRAATPAVAVQFGARNATFFHPELGKRLDAVSFEGTYDNGARHRAATSTLALRGVQARLDGHPVQGQLRLHNFDDPHLQFDFEGVAPLASLLALYEHDSLRAAEGELDIALHFDGRVRDLQSPQTVSRVAASGQVTARAVAFRYGQQALPFRQLSGTFIFGRNDVAIEGFSGQVGRSDFALEGYFRNLIPYLLLDNESLHAQARFRAQYLDLDELLSVTGSAQPEATAEYRFRLSPRLSYNLDCEVDRLTFRRFRGQYLRGKLIQEQQVLRAPRVVMQVAGGKVDMRASLNARQPGAVVAEVQGHLSGIHVDSAFYVFENFGQDFLLDRHLRGQLTAEVTAYLPFNDQLDLQEGQARAEADVWIREGALRQFEPMQALARFADRGELADLQFESLHNQLRIAHRTVYVPRMEIRSNVLDLTLTGTHTFDQELEYHFEIPTRHLRRRPDRDAAFGEIRDDGLGNAQVPLVMRGTTDNFQILYDTRVVRDKIRGGLQGEGSELRSARQAPDSLRRPAANAGESFDF